MIFDVNQTEFINKYQREVWSHGVRVIPLDISLDKISDTVMREGCEQVYDVIMAILTDMYENPQDYERYAAIYYLEKFFGWHKNGKQSIPVKIQKQHGMYEYILERMKRFGFTVEWDILKNNEYPLFLYYRELLVRNCGTCQGQIIPCDFRFFVKPYKRTMDDLLRPLPDTYKMIWQELYEYALKKGAKPESRKDHMFRWYYKKRCVLCLTNTQPNVEIPYRMTNTGGNDRNDFALFIDLAENQSDVDILVKYIQDNVCICNGCPGRVEGQRFGNDRCGMWLDIDGKRRLASICHTVIGRTKHGSRREPYTDYDADMLKRMLDLRFMQLDTIV